MKIDGREIAKEIFEDLKKRVGELKKKNIIPHLVIILVGNDPASVAYVRQKELKAGEIGAKATVMNYESGITNKELLKKIKELNNDNNVHGIIVQRPLPPQINNLEINLAVDPKKDIDAFRPHSPFPMPLAVAVIKILEKIYLEKLGPDSGSSTRMTSFWEGTNATTPESAYSNFTNWLRAKKVVVIGKGETGGRPIIERLKKMQVEPKIIDSKTENPNTILENADIVISAIGKSHSLDYKLIKKGAILISVGMYRGSDEKLHGDYEDEEIKDVASFYTPIPGGVGPVNVAMLLENLILAAEKI